MKKIYTQHALIGCAIAVLFAVSSCKKSATTPAPPATVSFTMKDTLIIASAYASTDPAIYNKYNRNIYAVNSKNKTMIIARKKSGTDHDFMLFFQDTSVYALPPYFEVIIKDADVNSFQTEYDLTDASKIQLHYHQRLKDGSVAINMNGKAISGTLKINYDKPYNTISGEITNLQVPIDFYTPMDIEENLPTRSNMLLLEGGSFRTVSLKFTYAEVGSAP
jgi:hypothetical protein